MNENEVQKEKPKENYYYLFRLLYLFIPLGLLLMHYYFRGNYYEKMLLENGVNTVCVPFAYAKGKMGVNGPKKGYYNQCKYFIGDRIHYCYVFTTKKPLSSDLKIIVRYYMENGKVVILEYPESDKYDEEYGFNDYGY